MSRVTLRFRNEIVEGRKSLVLSKDMQGRSILTNVARRKSHNRISKYQYC